MFWDGLSPGVCEKISWSHSDEGNNMGRRWEEKRRVSEVSGCWLLEEALVQALVLGQRLGGFGLISSTLSVT